MSPAGPSELLASTSRWAGRHYAHLVAPRPFFDAATVQWLDEQAGAEGWQPYPFQAGPPFLIRQWTKSEAPSDLTLVVLGWYPLLVTAGFLSNDQSSAAAEGRNSPSRRAINTIVDAFENMGGRAVTDAELAMCLNEVRERWQEAESIRLSTEQHGILVEYRQCPECQVRSGYDASHCRACGRRFNAQDDLAREAQREMAQKVIAENDRSLSVLANGEGLFTDWPSTKDSAVVVLANRSKGR